MATTKDLLPGGAADGMPDKRFNKRELRKGMKQEMDHTQSKTIAKEIAKDHLVAEDPKYYSNCEKMHKESRAEPVLEGLAHKQQPGSKQARCWKGYEPVPGKEPYSEDSCRPVGSKKKKSTKKEMQKKSALELLYTRSVDTQPEVTVQSAGNSPSSVLSKYASVGQNVGEFIDNHPNVVNYTARPAIGAGLGYLLNALYNDIQPPKDDAERKLRRRMALLSGAGVGLGTAISSSLKENLRK